jgi:hypothetical protein
MDGWLDVVICLKKMRNFPPQFLRDFAYIKTDPMQNRDDVVRYYCGGEREEMWTHVTTERGLVMKKFSGPLLHERHNLALKLVCKELLIILLILNLM